MSTTTYRRSYAADKTLGDRIFALLETCFPGIGARRREATLLDVVAKTLPSIDQLMSALAYDIDEIVFYFSPDRFAVEARTEPHRYDGDDYMVRGPFAIEGKPFMVPRSARH
jgi:hypothetical protein